MPGLTSLTHVAREVLVQGNQTLTSLDLSALTTIGSYLELQGNTALTSVDLHALTSSMP